jgi:hypothetical protein
MNDQQMASLHELQTDCKKLRAELAHLRNLRNNTTNDQDRARLIMEIANFQIELCHSRTRLSAHMAQTANWVKRVYPQLK